jgi:hypothetical protein
MNFMELRAIGWNEYVNKTQIELAIEDESTSTIYYGNFNNEF